MNTLTHSPLNGIDFELQHSLTLIITQRLHRLMIIGALSPFECIPRYFKQHALDHYPLSPFHLLLCHFDVILFMIVLSRTGTGLYSVGDSVAVSPIDGKCSKLRPFAIW